MIARLRRGLPAVGVFAAVLAAWEASVVGFRIERILLPRPSDILTTFLDQWSTVWAAGFVTLREALGGLAIGTGLGALAAMGAARWSVLREVAMPFSIAAGSAPIVVLAPIFNQWFGITSPLAKMSVVAVMVFFPIMINLVRGLTTVDPRQLELMRSLAAPDRATLRKVRLPHALPYLFNGLKVAAVLSLIGAIVAEYFGGSRDALGVYISQQAGLPRMAEAWAGIIVAILLGAGMHAVIVLAERRLMPWHVSVRGTRT
jgi:NitT/TauT family transport system permease protein